MGFLCKIDNLCEIWLLESRLVVIIRPLLNPANPLGGVRPRVLANAPKCPLQDLGADAYFPSRQFLQIQLCLLRLADFSKSRS